MDSKLAAFTHRLGMKKSSEDLADYCLGHDQGLRRSGKTLHSAVWQRGQAMLHAHPQVDPQPPIT